MTQPVGSGESVSRDQILCFAFVSGGAQTNYGAQMASYTQHSVAPSVAPPFSEPQAGWGPASSNSVPRVANSAAASNYNNQTMMEGVVKHIIRRGVHFIRSTDRIAAILVPNRRAVERVAVRIIIR